MSTQYSKHVGSKKTATQDQKILGSNQVQNSDGHYVWAVDNWKRLDRWLILGSEGGSYYASERALTQENAQAVLECLKQNGARTVARIVEVSDRGLAPKNDPAIFALALASVHGDEATRMYANHAMPQVCRTGTHLFQWAAARNDMAGWGRGARGAIARWYNSKDPDSLSYQLVKYQARNGWSHRDLLRLSHAKPVDEAHNQLYSFATGKLVIKGSALENPPDGLPEILQGFLAIQEAAVGGSEKQVAELIAQYNLPREVVPTEYLKSPAVWDALLQRMPLTALIRNLGNLSKSGLLKPLSAAEKLVVSKLGDAEYLKKSRVHPLNILVAATTYAGGRGVRGAGQWEVSNKVVEALDGAFYAAFQNVTPAGKRFMLAVDTSGSMTMYNCNGIPSISARIGSAAMAMVTVATEPQVHSIAFSNRAQELRLTSKMSLQEVVREIESKGAVDTDISAPMRHALERKLEVDAFVVYTDNETNVSGRLQPAAALNQYRDKMGIDARLVVVGMVSNGFSVADPNDSGQLDCVGFDTTTPSVISGFARGDI